MIALSFFDSWDSMQYFPALFLLLIPILVNYFLCCHTNNALIFYLYMLRSELKMSSSKCFKERTQLARNSICQSAEADRITQREKESV